MWYFIQSGIAVIIKILFIHGLMNEAKDAPYACFSFGAFSFGIF
jgi:hypothetical protein